MPELANKKHELACQSYLLSLDKTKAVIAAGYAKKSAKQMATKIFARPEVEARKEELLRERMARTQSDADRTVREIELVAYSNLGDFIEMDEAGHFKLCKPFHELPKDVTACIASVGHDAYGQLTVKLHSKVAALDLLGKHQGIFEKDNSQKPGVVLVKDYRDAEVAGFDADGQPTG